MTLIFLASMFALGALLASFAGVVAERLNTGQSWRTGRSRCNSCNQALAPRDLIPILSWTFSAGKCRRCGARVPALYTLIEMTLGLLFVLVAARLPFGLPLILFLVVLVLLTIIVVYDLRHTVVPMGATTVLLLLTFSYAILAATNIHSLGIVLAIAGATGLGFFLLHLFSGGKAMGLGDAPVATALALLVGSEAVAGLLFSFWIGAIVGLGILLLRRGGPTMGIEVPFVPFLAVGYLLAFFTQWNPLSLVLF